jgi:site-specific recombinase XerD
LSKQVEEKIKDIDWEDPTLQRWLNPITKNSTKWAYITAFRGYAEWTKKTASELIDEAYEDLRRDPKEKRDVVLQRLKSFYNYLKNDYEVKSRGRGKHVAQKKGLSDKAATLYISAIRSFYSTFDINIKLTGRNKLPKPHVKNKRIIFKPEDVWKVKALVDHARNTRDRALVLFHFQGGLDVSTLCSLDYGDVREGLEKNEHPLKIEPMRVKTGVEFYTFVGTDAIEALKAYLADMRSRGVQFTDQTPLFLQERGKNRLRTHNIQTMIKDLAVRAGFVTEENNGNSFNPLGTHSLRESFGSLMTNSGAPDTIVDFWLGHDIGDMAKAYKTVQFEDLKQMYLEREHLLSISAAKGEVERVEAKLKNDIGSIAIENQELKKEIKSIKEQISGMYEFVHKNLDPVLDLFNEIMATSEGKELLKKIHQEKAIAEQREAQ